MADGYRLTFGLTVAAALGCVGAGVWMTTLPMMSGGRYPTVGEALAMVALPTLASLMASWAAWCGRRAFVIGAAMIAGLYSLVTGFSFGSAFYPALGCLVWAVIATIDAGPSAGDADTTI